MNLLVPLYFVADRLRQWRRKNVGAFGEDLAHRYLRRNGYVVVARNWRPPQGGGEIDLIAWEGKTLVFVEVKTRSSSGLSNPEREIDDEKRRILRRTAADYIRRAGHPDSKYRMDVLAIDPVRSSDFQVRHYRNSFRISV